MKIRTKLILLYLLSASLTSVITAVAIRSYRGLESDFQMVMNDSVKKIETLRQVERSALRIVASTSEFSLIKSEKESQKAETFQPATENRAFEEEEEKELVEGLKKYYEAFNQYEDLVKNSANEKEDNLEEIKSAVDNLIKNGAVLLEMKKANIAGKRVLEQREKFEVAEREMSNIIEKSLQHQHEKLLARQNNVQQTIDFSTRNALIISALSFLFALVGGGLFSRSITNSINELRRATQRIGHGFLDTEVKITSSDEVADLAHDFQKMTSHLREARNELLKSKSFTENIIVSMADMLITVDDDGLIVSVNDAFLQQMGYEEKEIIGQPIKNLTQKSVFLSEKEFKKMIAERKIVDVEKDFVRRNGKKIRCLVSASLLKDQKSAAVVVAKDISQRIEDERKLKEYSTRLEQSNRELQDFAHVASHDLQEPLRKVQAFGDRLNRKFADKLGEEGNDYVRRMREASSRMQTLINDLLTFSRVTTKAQPFQSVDIEKITHEVVSDLEVRIEETNGVVEVGELPQIDADPVQMRQLMQNLIGNALKFHHPNQSPKIKIYVTQIAQSNGNTGSFSINGETLQTQGIGENFCQIAVQDNGIGFDEKYLDRIFTVFQRLHTRTEYEGSGVGLAVCRKIVERHGGCITAQSKAGEGATFLINLPIDQIYKETNHNENGL